MKIICQIGVIFAVCWFSQLIEAALPVPFPASVIGMLLLLALLATALSIRFTLRLLERRKSRV